MIGAFVGDVVGSEVVGDCVGNVVGSDVVGDTVAQNGGRPHR